MQPVIASALAQLTGFTDAPFSTCELANVTICPALESGGQQVVAIWNAQGVARSGVPVMLPIALAGAASYAVYDSNGNPVTAQLLPLSAADLSLRAINSGNSVASLQWLAFIAGNVSAAGYTTFFLVPAATTAEAPLTHISVPVTMAINPDGAKLRARAGKTHRRTGKASREQQEQPVEARFSAVGAASSDQTLSNGRISLTISGTSGMVSSYSDAVTGITAPLTQSWFWYNSSAGNNAASGQPSGAYIFRPNASAPFAIEGASGITVSLITGPVVSEARQAFGYVSQVVRLWAGAPSVDFEWTVGHVPTNLGHEVVARYDAGLASNSVFYTDSNGREMQQRVRYVRPTYNLTVTVRPEHEPDACMI